jgi:hypothetical protein
MVSVIKGIEPRDHIESMLAAQMAALHMAFMEFLRHLPLIESLQQQDSVVRTINSFARTYAAHMDTLKRYRSGGEQKILVQHVSVSEGGQAIVGNVTQNRRETAPDKVASSTLALSHSKATPMEVLNATSRERTSVRRKSSK